MLRKMSVLVCGAAVVLMTAGAAAAQSTTQEVKDKTKTTAQKTATVLTDAEITTAVKTKFLADSQVGGLKIDVDTDHGVVTLTGPVHSAAEKNEAIRLAKTTAGVKKVVSKLEIETAATSGHTDATDKMKAETKEKSAEAKEMGHEAKEAVTDTSITTAVDTRLMKEKLSHDKSIVVHTKNGVVTLTGAVPTEADKAHAGDIARDTTGVKRVVNNLAIK